MCPSFATRKRSVLLSYLEMQLNHVLLLAVLPHHLFFSRPRLHYASFSFLILRSGASRGVVLGPLLPPLLLDEGSSVLM